MGRFFTGKEFEFQSAVENYRDQISSEYCSNDRDGGRKESDDHKDKIIELFRASPMDSRMGLLYIALRTMSQAVVTHGGYGSGNDSDRHTAWLREVGVRLTATLENIL